MGCGWRECCEEIVDFFGRKRLKMGRGPVMEGVNWCTIRQLVGYSLQVGKVSLTLSHSACVGRLSLRQ